MYLSLIRMNFTFSWHTYNLIWEVRKSNDVELNQGGHGTGKTGNLVLTFSRQGKHREFCCNTGKVFETQGKYF